MNRLEDIQNKLKSTLPKKRYEHTIGVMYTASCMAMAYDYDVKKAMLAGLLHDCAKCLTLEEMVHLCEENQVKITDFEYRNKELLHAKAGAILAKIEYDVKDEEILNAIVFHTTGKPQMNMLEKIIFISDYIEPTRDKAPNLQRIRKLAFENIDECVAEILNDTLSYLKSCETEIDETTELTFQFYKQYKKERI